MSFDKLVEFREGEEAGIYDRRNSLSIFKEVGIFRLFFEDREEIDEF